MSASLFDPVIDGGIRNPNWFEGRLLTAQSLREKDKAERLRERLLGRAIGAGIVDGLWVTRGTADSSGVFKTITISKGTALNGDGDVLALPQDITVDVVPPAAPTQVEPTLFARCQDPPAVATIPSGFGIYVLVMSTASGYRERAPKSGLGTEGVVTGCGDAFAVEGVRFRLEKLEPANISGIDAAARDELTNLVANSTDAQSRSLLRNLMAHYCLGTPELAQFPVDPFAKSQGVSDWLRYGALDDLHSLKRLTCCDVPVTLLLWNSTGVGYVDAWSARRTPIPASGDAAALGTSFPQRLLNEARARLNQFQDHLSDAIQAAADPTALALSNRFRYLPPAGLLPLQLSPIEGLSVPVFLAGQTYRGPFHVEGSRLSHVLLDSFGYPALDLRQHEMLWLYLVRENRVALDAGGTAHPTSYALFASGRMRNVADTRFDVNHWNYANYASLLIS